MPYVPSEKTDGKSQDRNLIDAEVEKAANELAKYTGYALRQAYFNFFYHLGFDLMYVAEHGDGNIGPLARVIYSVGEGYQYEGAFLGELNYAVTRLIQAVPQAKVRNGDWAGKDELRYWLYAITVSALTGAAWIIHNSTRGDAYGVAGVFEDIKDEYKWRVNRPYEAAQIIKSGDCYTTPYYTKLVEVVTPDGSVIGHVDLLLKRDSDTLNLDVMNVQLVVYKVDAKKTV